MGAIVGVADAKRRFSELLDRVAQGERIVIARRGTPVVALVAADEDARGPRATPAGFAAIAGALGELEEFDELVEDVYAARRKARDRDAPALG